MINAVKILIIVLLLTHFKWVIILLILPFQIVLSRYRKYRAKCKSNFIFKILAFPYWFWECKIFRGGWERWMLFQIASFPSCHIRKQIYRVLGAEVDNNVVFHFGTEIRCPCRLYIGKGTIIGDNAILDARCGLTMGENVNLSSNVSIYTLQHDHRDPYFKCTESVKGEVKICDRAWIGSNVIILPGVTIGEGAVCCAGCVVTKDVEPYTVVAGIPAKKVNERPQYLLYEFDGKSCRLY